MKLHEQLKKEVMEAMKAKDEIRLNTIRSILTGCMNLAVEKGIKPQDFLEDADVFAVIKKQVKQRKDAAEQFEKVNYKDQAAKELAECALLEKYLPAMMSEEEVKKIVTAKQAEMGVTDPKEKGKFIGAMNKELAGKADGAVIAKVVNDLFA